MLKTTVLTGEAAGTEYDKTGGGSNVICIDLNVSYLPGKYIDGKQGEKLTEIVSRFFLLNGINKSFRIDGTQKF